MTEWYLGIDYGAGETVAAVATAGSASVARLGRSYSIASLVYLADDGSLVVGDEAAEMSRANPDRSMIMVDSLVGTREALFPGRSQATALDATAALLRHVLEVVRAGQQGLPTGVSVAHPTRWRAPRQKDLTEAAEAAGIDRPVLVSVSTAAANRLASQLRPAQIAAVYLLGSTTCEAAVLQRTATGWSELGRARSIDFGGSDLDRRLLEHVAGQLPETDSALALAGGSSDGVRPWSELVRLAREELSVRPTALLDAPGGRSIRVTREELDEILEPVLRPSIDLLVATVERTGNRPDELAAVVVSGAASNLPLIDRLISDALGHAPAASDQRMGDAALGAALMSMADGTLPNLVPLVPPRPPEMSKSAAKRPEPEPVPAGPGANADPDVTPLVQLVPAPTGDFVPPAVAIDGRRGAGDDRSRRSTVVRPITLPVTDGGAPGGDTKKTVGREPGGNPSRRVALIVAGGAALVGLLYVLAYPQVLGGLFGAGAGGPSNSPPAPIASPSISPGATTTPSPSIPPVATPTAPAPTLQTAPTSEPAARLAAMVPPAATNCVPADLEQGQTAGLQCSAPGVDQLWYWLMADSSELQAMVSTLRTNMANESLVSNEALCPGETWRYQDDPEKFVRGSMICFVGTDGTAIIVSTLDEALVVYRLESAGGNLSNLVESWKTLAPHLPSG